MLSNPDCLSPAQKPAALVEKKNDTVFTIAVDSHLDLKRFVIVLSHITTLVITAYKSTLNLTFCNQFPHFVETLQWLEHNLFYAERKLLQLRRFYSSDRFAEKQKSQTYSAIVKTPLSLIVNNQATIFAVVKGIAPARDTTCS